MVGKGLDASIYPEAPLLLVTRPVQLYQNPYRVRRVQEVQPTHSLLSRLRDMFVSIEERSNVHGLAPPDIAMDCPVQGELEASAIERAVSRCVSIYGPALKQNQHHGAYVTACLLVMMLECRESQYRYVQEVPISVCGGLATGTAILDRHILVN